MIVSANAGCTFSAATLARDQLGGKARGFHPSQPVKYEIGIMQGDGSAEVLPFPSSGLAECRSGVMLTGLWHLKTFMCSTI